MSVHEDLIRKHLDGLATDEDRQALERLLFESPVAADAFARASRMDHALGRHFRQEEALTSIQTREKSRRLPLAFSPQAILAILDAYDRTEKIAPDPSDLRDCIAKLPPRSQSLLALRYERSLKLAQIAREVGSTLDAVHKLLTRIRENLQECLQRRLQSDPE